MLLQERSEIALKKVVVDMGAVKFVANGADVMRPGIVSFDENLAKDEIVLIVDERFGKSLAIGLALLSASELKATDKGKAIKISTMLAIGYGISGRCKENPGYRRFSYS
jgi:Predicted RNA-binding protein (contains PUA domain)